MPAVAPSLATAPTAEQLAAIDDPVERAQLISEVARRCGTLPGWMSQLRIQALVEARRAGRRVADIAQVLALNPDRIYGLTGPLVGRTK